MTITTTLHAPLTPASPAIQRPARRTGTDQMLKLRQRFIPPGAITSHRGASRRGQGSRLPAPGGRCRVGPVGTTLSEGRQVGGGRGQASAPKHHKCRCGCDTRLATASTRPSAAPATESRDAHDRPQAQPGRRRSRPATRDVASPPTVQPIRRAQYGQPSAPCSRAPPPPRPSRARAAAPRGTGCAAAHTRPRRYRRGRTAGRRARSRSRATVSSSARRRCRCASRRARSGCCRSLRPTRARFGSRRRSNRPST